MRPSSSPSVYLGAVAPLAKCPRRFRLYHRESMRRIEVDCRQRRCGYCGPMHWRPRALATYHAGIVGDRRLFVALLLTAPGDVDVEVWNASAASRWHTFVTILRRSYPGFGFWRIAELQARGAVHFHASLRGYRRYDVGIVRRAALAAGFGSWIGLRAQWRYAHGAQGGALYFGKYMLKDYPRASSGVVKIVGYSNGWKVGWKAPARPQRGEWVWMGRAEAPWRFSGWEIEAPRPVRAVEARPWWWNDTWQAARARWAETRAIWPIDGPESIG